MSRITINVFMVNRTNSAEVGMSEVADQQQLETQPAGDDLLQGVKRVLRHAVQAYGDGLKVYQSLQKSQRGDWHGVR